MALIKPADSDTQVPAKSLLHALRSRHLNEAKSVWLDFYNAVEPRLQSGSALYKKYTRKHGAFCKVVMLDAQYYRISSGYYSNEFIAGQFTQTARYPLCFFWLRPKIMKIPASNKPT